jgi:hypothetical protein
MCRPWYTSPMSDQRNTPVRVRNFSAVDQEKLLEETILEWRALGPSAAWSAIYDMLGWWFAARGLDPEVQRVDRSHLEIHPVPWLTGSTTTEAGERASPKEAAHA